MKILELQDILVKLDIRWGVILRVLKDLIKKEVLNADATIMGKVTDVVIDDETYEITDLVVKKTGLSDSLKASTSGENLVPIEMISVIGDKLLIEKNEEI